MIYEELQETKKLVYKLLEKDAEYSINEISLDKAAKLLHVGSDTVLGCVHNGKLKARTYRDKNKVKRYRFRLADIREFQKRSSTLTIEERPEVESAEAMAERIFGTKKKRTA